MIYLFGTGNQISIIVRGDTLTATEKESATLVLDTLPDPVPQEGKYSVLCIDEVTKEVYYEYIAYQELEVIESEE